MRIALCKREERLEPYRRKFLFKKLGYDSIGKKAERIGYDYMQPQDSPSNTPKQYMVNIIFA